MSSTANKNSVELRRAREALYEAQNGQCAYCGRFLCIAHATLDHKIPRSRGGVNARSNLVVACKRCNTLKGDGTEWMLRRKLMRMTTPKGEE